VQNSAKKSLTPSLWLGVAKVGPKPPFRKKTTQYD
jgi:hypothetical protein